MDPNNYPAPDLSVRQFTVRAILTGMLLGGTLSLCNVYAGLKIGWGFNMSVTAAILSYGFWEAMRVIAGTPSWGKLENNINQTAASSAASISSAGLVAPIPALAMITGQELSYWPLVIWCLSVSLVGVVVAVGLRRQMLIVDALPFPNGIATAETLKEMYSRGSEALARVKALLSGAIVAGGMKAAIKLVPIKKITLPFTLSTQAGGTVAGKGFASLSLKNLTFMLDPSPLFLGFGAIIGFRSGASMLLGAIVAYGVLGPWTLEQGWTEPGKADAMWFGALSVKWLLWPGVVIMVVASLTSFAFSWRAVLNAFKGKNKTGSPVDTKADEVPKKVFWSCLAVAAIVSIILQYLLFEIGLGIATFGIALTFVLAIVAARVSGETGITPVGPMGKVTQLTFGVIEPGSVNANLMAANVTGGAASQCGDLLHDMKTGLMIGASPRLQTYAQFFGVVAGALAGSAGYLILIQDPASQLLTEEWAAPAVAQWKAVAELFKDGLDKLPAGAIEAMWIGAAAAMVLAVLEKVLSKKIARWIPSPTAMGLAFVIPALYSVSMFLGGLIAVILQRFAPNWASRFLIVTAAGIIAGDSLVGVGFAFTKLDWSAFWN